MTAVASGNILVVDDNDAGRYIKRRTLEQAGHSVAEAREGFEALRMIVASKPEVVVLDVKLPDILGTELCRKLRENNVSVCVLMTSAAFIDPADRVTALESGADAYLVEPFDPTELVAAVGSLLRLSRAEGNLRAMNATLGEKVAERTRELAAAAVDLEAAKENSARAEEALWHTQKLEAIGRLTGGIAHDFNNLLTVVLGNLELLERGLLHDAPSNAKWLRHIRSGRRAANDCADIVRQLLVFARRDGLRSEAIDLNKTVLRLEDFIRRSVGEQVAVQIVTSKEPVVCKIDPTHFEAALLNLAINARDAMPTGGSLRIALRTVSVAPGQALDTAVPVPAELQPGNYALVSVSDTGVGIGPEIASRVFEPFFTTKDIGKGSGLGLSQVFGFVKQSGGMIALDSAPGKGARFGLYLPLTGEHATQPVPLDTVGTMPRGSGTILVVEDNDLVLDYVVAMTTELGYRVLRATTGREALDVIERGEPIDLLFTDVVMPNGMSGIDLARKVRQRRPDVKVLITSGYSNQKTDTSSDAEFMSLVKPYSSADLAKRLREVLGS